MRAGRGFVFCHAAEATPSLTPNVSGGVCFPSSSPAAPHPRPCAPPPPPSPFASTRLPLVPSTPRPAPLPTSRPMRQRSHPLHQLPPHARLPSEPLCAAVAPLRLRVASTLLAPASVPPPPSTPPPVRCICAPAPCTAAPPPVSVPAFPHLPSLAPNASGGVCSLSFLDICAYIDTKTCSYCKHENRSTSDSRKSECCVTLFG